MPQKHGGALRHGGTNKGGPGRPKEELREQLRGLAHGQGIPFLRDLLAGEVRFKLIGTCPSCKTEHKLDPAELDLLINKIDTSVEHRLRANDLAFKYGVGTQNESLDPEEGKAFFQKVLGRMVDELTARGVPLTTSKAAYVAATEGL